MFYRVLATSQQFVWRGSQSIDKRLEWPHFAQKASLYTMGGMAQIVSKYYEASFIRSLQPSVHVELLGSKIIRSTFLVI